MPKIHPIHAITYAVPLGGDVSALIAPPYDVLDSDAKSSLLRRNPSNIVAVDLPHLPSRTVGPDHIYARAGERFRQWLNRGILKRRQEPCCFVYRQTFAIGHRRHRRLGLMANVRIQPFDAHNVGDGAIYPHEQTFSSPTEDRLKLMRASVAQLSPIFALFHDPSGKAYPMLSQIAEATAADSHGTTANDGVLHELWAAPGRDEALQQLLDPKDLFIADGHHRYTTALRYQREVIEVGGPISPDHPANFCLFVLVAMEDPGTIILPTHRVLGGMVDFTLNELIEALTVQLAIRPFKGCDLHALAAALPGAGPHAFGLCHGRGARRSLAIVTTVDDDPLAAICAGRSEAWRQLDVAIVQHLVVEQLCQQNFCLPNTQARLRFPHALDQVQALLDGDEYQLGIVMQPMLVAEVQRVCKAGELMPQKSTFFYPKLATGLVVNPLA